MLMTNYPLATVRNLSPSFTISYSFLAFTISYPLSTSHSPSPLAFTIPYPLATISCFEEAL
jgi:hypothetical protein